MTPNSLTCASIARKVTARCALCACIFVTLCSLGTILGAAANADLVFEVEGKYARTVYSTSTIPTVVFSENGSFRAIFDSCRWSISTVANGNVTDVGTDDDGRTVFTVVRAKPGANGTTTAPDEAYIEGVLPAFAQDARIAAYLFLAFGSQCYLNQISDGKIVPLLFPADGFKRYYYDNQQSPIRLFWLGESKRFPSQIAFICKESPVWTTHDDQFHVGADAKSAPGWASSGYTNLLFETESNGSPAGFMVPTAFRIRKFVPLKSENLFAQVEQAKFEATTIAKTTRKSSYVPELKTSTSIVDCRLATESERLPEVVCHGLTKWPTLSETRERPEYSRAIVAFQSQHKAALAREAKRNRLPNMRLYIIGSMIIFTILLGCGWRSLRRVDSDN